MLKEKIKIYGISTSGLIPVIPRFSPDLLIQIFFEILIIIASLICLYGIIWIIRKIRSPSNSNNWVKKKSYAIKEVEKWQKSVSKKGKKNIGFISDEFLNPEKVLYHIKKETELGVDLIEYFNNIRIKFETWNKGR